MVLHGWAPPRRARGRGHRPDATGRCRLAGHGGRGRTCHYFLVLLAEAYGNVGQVDAGWRCWPRRASVVDKGERYWEAELYRVKGELLLACATAQHAEAETSLQQALDVARRQQAKSLELRAATEPEPPVAAPGQAHRGIRLLAPSTAGSPKALTLLTSRKARGLLVALGEDG